MMWRCFVVLLVLMLPRSSSAQSPDASATPDQAGPSDQAASDQAASDQAASDQAASDQAASDQAGAPERASDDASETPLPAADREDPSDRAERLADYLTDVKFIGKFTVDGRPDAKPKEEEYTIARCEKLPAENLYRLTARIQYGDVDSEVPMDLKILWAGNTPVITLDAMWIPGMGTFSARVLIHSDRYSGTWQHGDKGGHLFGKIVPNEPSP